MNSVPTFATRPTFLGVEQANTDAAICVAGIPFDLGTSNRPGARFGPAAIRQASRMLVDGDHPASWAEMGRLDLADVGDFRIAHGDIPSTLAKIAEQAASFDHLVSLGGDHTITLALLRALSRRKGALGLVHFDGHVDTWPESFGLVWSHGSPFYHAIEEGLVDPRHMIQIGIRSPLHRDIFDWTVGKGVTIVTAEDVHESGPPAVAERIRAVIGDRVSYLSFDIDALDPAFAPGTGTPEVGGLATWQARAILRRLTGLNFAGMDVVEVSPPYDVAEITALAAATIAWDYIGLLAPR
jgi:agmatinase